MEQGQIGDKYFVAVGIEKSNLNKYNVSYNMILEVKMNVVSKIIFTFITFMLANCAANSATE